MQQRRGVRVGRPAGLHITIHRSWVPAAAFACAHLTIWVFGAYPLPTALGLSVATVAACALSVLIHELAHAGPARRSRASIGEITLYPFGGVPRYGYDPDEPAPEAVVAFSGVAVTVFVAAAAYGGSLYFTGVTGRLLWTVAVWNAGLAALNLIPGLPLDGGRFVRALLWARSGDRHLATRTAARWGQLAGLLLGVAGVVLFLRDPSAPSGWGGLWLALAGVFVVYGGGTLRRAGRLEAALDGRTAGAWARPFAGRLAPDDVVPQAAGVFAVADRGRLAGIASGEEAGKVASEAMVPWSSKLSCSASEALPSALRRMAAADAAALVVLDEQGVVRGVLSPGVVREHMRGGR